MNLDLLFAQDLCARLCHDLGGPLGTVAAATDLLEEEPDAADLAREAAAVLRGRLEFWRAACGGGTGPMRLDAIGDLLTGVLAGGRARLSVENLPPDRVLDAMATQLLLVAAMLAGEGLPRGGRVRLEAAGVAGLVLWPEGGQAAWSAGLAEALAGQPRPGPRDVLSAILPRLAQRAGWIPHLITTPQGPRLLLSPAA